MKLLQIIEMQLDYMIFKKYKRGVQKSDTKIKKLREELEIEEAYNKIMSEKTLKLCKEYREKYGNLIEE